MVKGNVIGKKVQSLAGAQPTSQEYGSSDVYRERSYAFGRLILGMGERVQQTQVPRRYRYAINAWFAGNMRGKGPQFTAITPPSTGEIRDFPEALHGGVLTQFILAGRYVLRRTGDLAAEQVVSKDLGAGVQAQSAVRFKHAGGAPVDGLYAATDNKQLWRYDGAAWAQMETSATIPAQWLEVTGDELWRAWDNQVSKCTADPAVAANWSGAITVGDSSSNITALRQLSGRLFIFKDDGGVYTVAADGTDNELFPGLRTTRTSANGRGAAAWLDGIYFRQHDSLFRLSAGDGTTVTQIGPERLAENDSEVAGQPVCFAGFAAWYGLIGVYNPLTVSSYLLQYGNWLPPDEGETAEYDFATVINGALVKWTNKQISALRVSTLAAGNPRLFAGFTDGSMGWLLLPRSTPNPFASNSGCTFTQETSQVFWPTHTLLAPADDKAYLSFAAAGPVLNSTSYVDVAYQTAGGSGYTPLGEPLVTTGLPVEIDPVPVAKSIDVRETFVSASNSATPVVESVILREQLRPALRLEYQFTVLGKNYAPKRNGGVDRKTAEQVRLLVRNAAAAPGTVTLTMPDEVAEGFSSVDYAEVLAAERARHGVEWELPASFVQFKVNVVLGTFARVSNLTYGDLGTTTFAEMGTF